MTRRLIALLTLLLVAGVPLAGAVPCADAEAGSCCCPAPSDDCRMGSDRSCGCLVDGGPEGAPPPAAPAPDARHDTSPAAAALPAAALVSAAPAVSAAPIGAHALPRAQRLHLLHSVLLC